MKRRQIRAADGYIYDHWSSGYPLGAVAVRIEGEPWKDIPESQQHAQIVALLRKRKEAATRKR